MDELLSSWESHGFLLRFWQERREIEHAPAEWRGMIEDLPTGERRYISLGDAPAEGMNLLCAWVAEFVSSRLGSRHSSG